MTSFADEIDCLNVVDEVRLLINDFLAKNREKRGELYEDLLSCVPSQSEDGEPMTAMALAEELAVLVGSRQGEGFRSNAIAVREEQLIDNLRALGCGR